MIGLLNRREVCIEDDEKECERNTLRVCVEAIAVHDVNEGGDVEEHVDNDKTLQGVVEGDIGCVGLQLKCVEPGMNPGQVESENKSDGCEIREVDVVVEVGEEDGGDGEED